MRTQTLIQKLWTMKVLRWRCRFHQCVLRNCDANRCHQILRWCTGRTIVLKLRNSAVVIRTYRRKGPETRTIGSQWSEPAVVSRAVWKLLLTSEYCRIITWPDNLLEGYTSGLLTCYVDGATCTIEELEEATGVTRNEILAQIAKGESDGLDHSA